MSDALRDAQICPSPAHALGIVDTLRDPSPGEPELDWTDWEDLGAQYVRRELRSGRDVWAHETIVEEVAS